MRPRSPISTHQELTLLMQAACEAAWRSFLRGFGSRYLRLRAVVQALAALDCLCGLAVLAANHGWAGGVARRAAAQTALPPRFRLRRRSACNAARSSCATASIHLPASRQP